MIFKKNITMVLLSCTLSTSVFAAPSINDMQACQALLDFIEGKISSPPAKYSVNDVKAIRLGLKQYNDYI